jgi:hypothetical protein
MLPMDRTTEVEQLARLFLARGVIPPAKMEDALHVAFAAVYAPLEVEDEAD